MKFEILICLPLFLSIVSSAFTTYFVDDSEGLGRRFDGIGGLSGGGVGSWETGCFGRCRFGLMGVGPSFGLF